MSNRKRILKQGVVILSALAVAFLGVILYTPLPDGMEQPWNLRLYYAKSKLAIITGELCGLFGYRSIHISRYLLDSILLTHGTSINNPYLDVKNVTLDGIPARIYKPKDKHDYLPCFIFIHGGGFVYSIDSYDGVAAKIAQDTNMTVIAVEYRLIPEFPYPAALNDVYRATRFILQNAISLGIDPLKVSIGGDSAGGNTAAAVALKLRDDNIQPKLLGQVLIYPVLQACDLYTPSNLLGTRYLFDGRAFAAEMAVMALGIPDRFRDFIAKGNYSSPELTKKCKRFVNYNYLPHQLIPHGYKRTDITSDPAHEDAKYLEEKYSDPYFVPLMSEILSNLPQTLVVTTQLDHLRDDGIIYHKRLLKAGVKSDWRHLPDSFHGVLTMIGDGGFDAGLTMIDHITTFLKQISFES
ncbi:hypothetical protein LOTGIDRAFT_231215 [Lottia gigantea]|uniref:Alpha/beta hydrolase fold-3 domain-containing protein n=1 Tax=Lottia gigantea TaxID=225164 RepID=V4A4R1_LOTGI|nr:hypothetical protein LOTGIDRAFT_231215 [Lottia gigantea]ESO98863.1 hypothetical protein LOTGIDRAFT_231215 [Lottia gigantea]